MSPLLRGLLKIHRWIAIVFSILFLLVIVSGMVLAFKPVVDAQASANVDIPTLIAALKTADPAGKAGAVAISRDGTQLSLSGRGAGPSGNFDLHSGAKVSEAGFDLFSFARRLHENLLIGANWLVTATTIAMVFLIVSGLFFGWRTLRNNATGWHLGLGWLSWPLLALTPVTGLLMAFHLGMPQLPDYTPARRPLPLAEAITTASQNADLSGLTLARNFRAGAVMLTTRTDSGHAQYLVSGSGEFRSMSGPGWVRSLHEGTWAGAWSGILTLLSTFPLLGLMGTGLWTWWRRAQQRRARRQTVPGQAHA
jgi:sulfite reductase (NADPH) flavoprotein alpha-component